MGEERRAGKVLRFTVSAALLLGSTALTGCGDEEGPTVNEPEPTHTINEPAEPTPPAQVVPEPTPNLTEEEATGVATPPEPLGEPAPPPPDPIPPG